MNEKFLLCEVCKVPREKGDIYYIMVYSSLTQGVEKVFIDKGSYEFLLANKNVDINNYLTRYYNQFKSIFAIKYGKKI